MLERFLLAIVATGALNLLVHGTPHAAVVPKPLRVNALAIAPEPVKTARVP